MKNLILFFLTIISFCAVSQNVAINGTGTAPNASAMLDVASANTGLLIPRVALTSILVASPVTSPATSLLIYNTATAGTSPNDVVPGYYFWDGAKWARLYSGNFLNSTSIAAVGKFYSTLSWTGTWANGTTLSFTITDPNMVCATNASAAFVSFDCSYTTATIAGFSIRSVKCNSGNFVVSVTNNSGINYGAGGLPITYVAFY